jgi:hypothetical protein
MFGLGRRCKVRHAFVDPQLLQRVRLEIAAHGDGELSFDGLPDVGPDKLRAHLERLFYAGELAADARIEAGGLVLKPRRLTPYGVLAMHAGIARGRAPRAA